MLAACSNKGSQPWLCVLRKEIRQTIVQYFNIGFINFQPASLDHIKSHCTYCSTSQLRLRLISTIYSMYATQLFVIGLIMLMIGSVPWVLTWWLYFSLTIIEIDFFQCFCNSQICLHNLFIIFTTYTVCGIFFFFNITLHIYIELCKK